MIFWKGRCDIKTICEVKDGKVILDKGYLERLFVRDPIINDKHKHLSALSLRLAIVLLQELSVIESRKLPSRTDLAHKLNVSKTAINDCLWQLEEVGFINRRDELDDLVCADENEGMKLKEKLRERKEVERRARRFSDYFILNYNYNISEEEDVDEMLSGLKDMMLGLDENAKKLTIEKLKEQIQSLVKNK